MEAVERAIYAFSSWKVMRVFYACGCISSNRKSKLFRRRWLKVGIPVEPELLIWENFGVTASSRVMRIIAYIIFIFLMLIVCLVLVSWLNLESGKIADLIPNNIPCPSTVDPYVANLDYTEATNSKEKVKFHCFCKNLLDKEGYEQMSKFTFPIKKGSEAPTYCNEWYTKFFMV